jgi:hypothetical protein
MRSSQSTQAAQAFRCVGISGSSRNCSQGRFFRQFCRENNKKSTVDNVEQAKKPTVDNVVLYAMTVGRLPFVADNCDMLLHKIVEEPVQYPGFLSPELTDLLQGLLQ